MDSSADVHGNGVSGRSSEHGVDHLKAHKVGMGGEFHSTGTADGGEHDDLSSMQRQSLMSAMGHLGHERENHLFKHKQTEQSEWQRGESEDLQNAQMAFLTDVDESDFQEGSATLETIKSEAQNSKNSYDIRDNAGFFARKSAKNKAINAGDLQYPKEFSPPGSAQGSRSTKGKTLLENEITDARGKAYPKSGVQVARNVTGGHLPGGLHLTRKDTRTYFGEESRAEFFERYKWLQSQRQNANTDPAVPTTQIMFPHSFQGSKAVVSDLWEEKPIPAPVTAASSGGGKVKSKAVHSTPSSNVANSTVTTTTSTSAAVITTSSAAATTGSASAIIAPQPSKLSRQGTKLSLLSPVHVRSPKGHVVETDPEDTPHTHLSLHTLGTIAGLMAPKAGKNKQKALGNSTGTHRNTTHSNATIRATANTLPSADHPGNRAPTNKSKSAKLALSSSLLSGESGKNNDLENSTELNNSNNADEVDSTTEASTADTSNITMSVTRTHPMYRPRTDDDDILEYPFAPVRAAEEVRVRTKVIIRTQSLLQGESYEQLKLVQKPMHLNSGSGSRANSRGGSPFGIDAGGGHSTDSGDGVSSSGSVTYHALSLMEMRDETVEPVHHAANSAHSTHSTHNSSAHSSHNSSAHNLSSAAHAAHNTHTTHTIHTSQSAPQTPTTAPPTTSLSSTTPLPNFSPPKPSPARPAAINTTAASSKSGKKMVVPRSPSPTKQSNNANAVSSGGKSAPPARGSSKSPFGPSKYNKVNPLLPSIHNNIHVYGQPFTPHTIRNESGNTAIGDVILNRLNATAKQMMLSLEMDLLKAKDSDHVIRPIPVHATHNAHGTHGVHHTHATHHVASHHSSAHLSAGLGGVHIPSGAHPVAVHTGHSPMGGHMHNMFANTVVHSAHDKHTAHTHHPHSTHAHPHSAHDITHSAHKKVTIEEGDTTTSNAGTNSAGNSAHDTHKLSPLKSALKQPASLSPLPNAAQHAHAHTTHHHTDTHEHPPNLESNVEVHYMGRSEFLGAEKIHNIHVNLKTVTPDRYSLLHPKKNTETEKLSGLDSLKPPVKLHPGGLKIGTNKLIVDVMHEGVLKQDEYNNFTFNKHGITGLSEYVPILEPPKPIVQAPSSFEVSQARFGYSISSMNSVHSVVDGVDVIHNTAVPPVELVCVEHRDGKNNKVSAVQHRVNKNSLFEYLESKKAGQYDFNGDISSDSEADDLLDVRRVDPVSPVSPLHHLVGSQDLDGHDDTSSVNSTEHSSVVSSMQGSAQGGARGSRHGRGSPSRGNTSGSVGGSLHISGISGISDGAGRRKRVKKEKKERQPQEGDISPRSQYIDACIRQRLNPRASLILRKNFTRHLQLQHHGIGDNMAILFAQAIVNIPYIESINISDNNLTDKGLGPLLESVVHMADLIDLDISYNTIGPVAAACLSTYLAKESCPLQRMVLRRADVDDGECERFVTSLKTNRCLLELDLSENLIGTAENLNTVMPDLVTGGEALADLLRSEGCVLKSLKLGWNMIRLDGAADLCSSLKVNTTLTYLDLSFNALGSIGGMALGDALQDNKVLKTLNVASNSIDSVACLTICAGVLENEALEHVIFDGNPIGEQGAKTLMLLPTMVGSRVRISAGSCNIGIRDANCTFDSSALVRRFELSMSNPFERAISLLVLYLIASHQTYVIGVSEYYDPETKTTTNLGLVEKVVVDYENKRLQKEQHEQIESLKIVQAAASDTESALALFREIDADGSGQLDEEEFGNLVTCMGLSMSAEQVRECMSEYDVDNGGVIEMSEFSLFIRNQAKEAERKLKELTEFPIMSVGAEKEIKRYIPPRTGTLTLVVVDGFTLKDTYRVLSTSDRNFINEIARQSGDLLTMTTYGVQSYKMRFNEAMGVAETLLKENSNKIEILSRILPNMASAADARMLVAKLLHNNKIEIQKLRREIGFALKPMLGVMDGHYSLDLGSQMDKFCLNKLLEVGMTIAFRRAKKSRLGYGILGDCSQKGNWSSFRNEMFNGKPVTVTTEFASPMPRSGRLEFDFVSEQRVGKDDFILNDVRFTNMLVRVFQVRSEERDFVLKRLAKTKERSDRTLGGDSRTVYEVSKQRATEIGEAMQVFYDNLARRQEQIDRFRQKEGIKVNMEFDPLTTVLTYKNVNQYLTIKSLLPPPVVTLASTSTDGATGGVGASSKNNGNATTPNTQRRKMNRRSSTAESTTSNTTSNTFNDFDNDSDNENADEYTSLPSTANTTTSANTAANKSGKSTGRGRAQSILNSTSTKNNTTSTVSTAPTTPSNVNTSTASNTSTTEGGAGNSVSFSVKVLDSWAEVEALGGADPSLIEMDPDTEGLLSGLSSRPPTSLAAAVDAITQMEGGGIRLDEYMRRYVCVMASSNIQPQAKAVRTVELLVNAFEYHFIYARHLELLCEIFDEFGQVPCSEFFGTYRVELVISLFACVVDLHNFEIVMRRLTPFEVACVTCRLGWLHLYNPMKPEGAYQLDLTRREERLMVKTLAQLATAEPGDNLPSVTFRWERDMASMPGYELTEPWLTEEGLPKKGIWDVVYYAGEGKGEKGCKPMPKLRRALLQLVFLEEGDVQSEADKEANAPPALFGEAFMMANLGIFHGYLAYNEEAHKALLLKKKASTPAKEKKRK